MGVCRNETKMKSASWKMCDTPEAIDRISNNVGEVWKASRLHNMFEASNKTILLQAKC